MKKTLIALAVLGAAGVAQAQTNVTIYGAVDLNYTKVTDTKTFMDERYNNRLGFMGSEDLGGGLKATFQLEERFNAYNGTSKGRGDFEGAANVGLASASMGAVRFGRLNEVSTETYRKIDPFEQYGIAGMYETVLRGNDGEGRLSSTARYDSPVFNGFKVMGTFTVRNNDAAMGYGGPLNSGWAIGATYTNGPIYAVANYNKAVNSDKSYNWNIGGSYAFGPAKISAGYEQTNLNSGITFDGVALGYDEKVKNWIIGGSYTIGAGVINASYNHSKWSEADVTGKKWGIGYTHNLSKRTSAYANYSHDKWTDTDAVNAFEIGLTHKF